MGSEFMQFVRQVGDGNLVLDGNKVCYTWEKDKVALLEGEGRGREAFLPDTS